MRYVTLLFLFVIAPAAFAQPVVATNGWTAAYARAAGAEVSVLAPYDMVHPPEYELRPSDIRTISNASLVVYAGYELMVSRLLESAGNADVTALQITTGYTRQIIADAITAIAAQIGTADAGNASIAQINGYLDSWAAAIGDSAWANAPAVVHFHQQGLARELGLNVVGVFGPGPLEARQIAQLTALNPQLIIDNAHNPVAAPLAETTGAALSVWINFPGTDGTRSLMDVLAYNRRALDAAAQPAQ